MELGHSYSSLFWLTSFLLLFRSGADGIPSKVIRRRNHLSFNPIAFVLCWHWTRQLSASGTQCLCCGGTNQSDDDNVDFFHFSVILDVCCFTRCIKGAILSSLPLAVSNVLLIPLIGSMTSKYELFQSFVCVMIAEDKFEFSMAKLIKKEYQA